MTTKQIEKELYNQLRTKHPFARESHIKIGVEYIIENGIKLIKKNLIKKIDIIETTKHNDDFKMYHLWINYYELCIDIWLKIEEN